jgi:two-component system cell cycle sensor histidine kinase PleC
VIARVDPKLMLQLLINLVSNAIKFSHAKGKVDIAVRLAEDRSIVIAVKDSGIGIAEDDIARVVRPFEQVEASYARTNGGTGLGLPIAVKLAELHGGSLVITSQLGTGTTVTVTLPPERLVETLPKRETLELNMASG